MIDSKIAAGVGLAVGAALAWGVQSVRLDSAIAEHETYVAEIKTRHSKALESADKQREETSREFAKRIAQIKADGDAYRRCVDAGKCGVREPLPGPLTCPGGEVQTSGRADAPGADAIPSPGVASAAAMSVVNDCAVTTLMLNELQADITKQLAR